MRTSWRRQKRETGLAAVCSRPRGIELWEQGGKERIGIVAAHAAGFGRETNGFYWYGLDHNSLWDSPLYATEEEAKTALKNYYLKTVRKPDKEAK